MRILLLNHVSRISGAENSMLALARDLYAEGVAVDAALPAGGPLGEQLRAIGVTVHDMPFPRLKRRLRGLVRGAFQLSRCSARTADLAERLDCDIIHCNSTTAAMAGVWAGKWSRLPVIWHVRDMVRWAHMAPVLGQMSAAVVAISPAVAESLRVQGVLSSKVVVIPPGIDTDRFQPGPPDPDVRYQLGANERGILFLAAGQFAPWKRFHDFVEAAAAVSAVAPDARYALVGCDLFGDHPGLEADLRQRVTAADLEDRFCFAGRREDMVAVYRAADVVVAPSQCEPFGRVMAEAMACGKPVIATRAGGPLSVIEHGSSGLLVPVADPGALAQAMRRLAAAPELRRKLAAAARERILGGFTTALSTQATLSLYQRLLRKR